MSFLCVYCDEMHPMSSHSKEHIVPIALGNQSYTLSNACQLINNYMAKSFEKGIINSEVIKEINMMLNYPQEPYFRRNLNSSVEPNLAHYIYPNGENKTVQKPHDVETNIISMQLKGKNEEEFIYELKLPFPIIGLKGKTDLLKPEYAERRLKRFKNQLENYLNELEENPSINPEFHNFIIKNNIIYDRRERKIIPKIIKNSPSNISSDESKVTIYLDDELLTKFFFKIAWTHAVKVFGKEKLINPISRYIFDYIISGHINDISLVHMYPELFLNPTKIGDEEYIFWKYDINKTLEIIRETVFKNDFYRVMKHYNYRCERFGLACNNIRISRIELLDDEIRKNANHLYRYHELSLKSETENWTNATVCVVKLYGGILQAEVLLSEKPIVTNFPQCLKIEI